MFGLALCAGAGITSCSSDLDDPMDTIPYNRVLTPMNFEAEVIASKGTDITFKWSAVQNASSYVLELFLAEESIETDDSGTETTVFVAPDYDNAVAYLSVEVGSDEIPYTVTDLEVDQTFYARVRGVSQSVSASHWAYLTEPVSTSAVRDMLNPFVVERTASTVTVGWDDADDKEDLTSIRVIPVVPAESETARTIALTDEQKENCEVEVDGLDACRNYKFTLLFGKSGSRGVVTAWTRPDTEGITRVESSEAFANAITSAQADVELVLAYNDGQLYDLTPYMALNASEGIYDPYDFAYGIKIIGESTEAGAKPVVRAAFKNSAASSLHMEDVVIDGGNQCGVFFVTGASLSDVEFINCEITAFTKGIYNGAAGFDVDNLIFNSVYAHDLNPVGAGAGDFIDIRGGNYGKVEIVNSTFYACARSFLRISETATKTVGSVNVANCTFNQVTATNTSSNNSGIFHLRYNPTSKPDSYMELGSFTLTNCVFLNMNNVNESASSYWVRLTRDSNENYAPTCAGNIFYNVGHDDYEKDNKPIPNTFFPTKSLNLKGDAFSKDLALAEGGMILEEDPCTNSIAGKMYLKNGIVAANRAGDPRWWDAAEPVVVRETELTAVTEPTEWDFTEKTKFQSETIETNQIIENIRIYAPAEVVMGEGVTFASASKLDKNGRPTSSALQFRVQGVGAVEVTTVDAGFNASVEVVAAGDRYTLLADGKTHKVVLGDLTGENDIYVLTGSAVTFTQVAWTDDLTPEATMTQLASPKVTIDNTSFDQGTEVAVTASWAAIENAASYEVTFQGKKSEVTEPSFTIDAATVSALAVGEYEISVVAKPVSTSSKYLASEAGVATFKVKKVILAGMTTVLWDFDASDFDAAAAVIGTTDNKEADATYTMGGLGLHIQSLGATMKVEERGEGRRLRTGGGSKPTSRAISFIVPKTTDAATVKIYGTNPSSSAASQTLTFTAQDKDGNVLATAEQPGAGYQEIKLMDALVLQEGTEVFICCSGGYRYAWIEFSYADPDAGPVEKEFVWDCNDSSFDPIGAAMGTDGSLTATIPDLVWDGLTILTGSKTKYGTTSIDGVDYRYIQWGGKGGANKDRSCYFTAPASGTLTVVASNTGSSLDEARLVAVTVNDVEYTQIGGTPTSAPTTVTFDIDIDEATTVYVYPSGNGLRFYSMKYTYME